jgi:Family of unknown function (DUF6410)
MSSKTGKRGFAVGREVGRWGRSTRLVLGLLGLILIGTTVAQARLSFALIGQMVGGLLLTAALYLTLFWRLGEGVAQPWLRTVIFWAPLAFVPLLFLIPWGWGFGVLLYWSVSCLMAALLSHGDCEIVAFPSLLFRRHYTVYCPLNAIDLVERPCTQR